MLSTFNKSLALRSLVLLASVSLFSIGARAAGAEADGFGGGVHFGDGLGTHGSFGGGGSFDVGDRVSILGEFRYNSLGSASASSGGTTASASAHAIDFGGGADFSFTDAKATVRPYVVGVAGLERLSAAVSVTGVGSASGSQDAVYYGGGGGLRYYIGKSWGIKPEVRYQHSVNTGNSVYFTVGLFYHSGR